MTSIRIRRPARHAVVIGGGLAGTLAAAACIPYVDKVTIVERDELPDGPVPRKGLPQARHAHMLWSGGARAMEALVPGVTDAWLAAGAHRIPLPTGMVSYSPAGWYRRWHKESHFLIACSRDLLDWTVRDRVLKSSAVRLLTGTEPQRLTGTSHRVDGVIVRLPDGAERHLAADLVVDACGRSSRAPQLLHGLGVPAPPEEEIDAGVVYASRLYKAPAVVEHPPVINIQADARRRRPGQAATIVPIEGDRWFVAVSGTRGGAPTGDTSEFVDFALGLRHPLVGEVLSRAEPLGDVAVSRSTVNRRRYWEKPAAAPEGFVIVGDAVAALNPVYGHGMSVAALGALALRNQLERSDVRSAGFARRVQRAVARPTDVAWTLATGQDMHFPGSKGRKPTAFDRLLQRYVNRLTLTAIGSFRVAKALTDVMTLQKGVAPLVRPDVVLAALRGPQLPLLGHPPLTDREREALTPETVSEADASTSG
ncbi:NAD(P)/FAD-dependent oxidoreductase [Streptomyces sp. NPDC057445]|uniref:NAD(P)/FAD-dependent oxidoreductase n=1 Tax=Streptomyces sp. NPDC057445 TaxID=3346136 RepID=UPI0036ADD8C7